MPEQFYISEPDAARIQEMWAWYRNQLKNQASRPGPLMADHEEHPAPEVYIARTPDEGIPGLYLGDLTGTGSLAPTDDVPSYAACEVWKISGVTLVQVPGLTKLVWNLSEDDIPGGVWIVITRDKYGSWLPINQTTGLCVSTDVVEVVNSITRLGDSLLVSSSDMSLGLDSDNCLTLISTSPDFQVIDVCCETVTGSPCVTCTDAPATACLVLSTKEAMPAPSFYCPDPTTWYPVLARIPLTRTTIGGAIAYTGYGEDTQESRDCSGTALKACYVVRIVNVCDDWEGRIDHWTVNNAVTCGPDGPPPGSAVNSGTAKFTWTGCTFPATGDSYDDPPLSAGFTVTVSEGDCEEVTGTGDGGDGGGCTGTQLITASSALFTAPCTGSYLFKVKAKGGSGANGTSSDGGGGGGGGGYAEKTWSLNAGDTVTISNTVNIVVTNNQNSQSFGATAGESGLGTTAGAGGSGSGSYDLQFSGGNGANASGANGGGGGGGAGDAANGSNASGATGGSGGTAGGGMGGNGGGLVGMPPGGGGGGGNSNGTGAAGGSGWVEVVW